MGEDDIVELLWKSGQVVQSSQTQRPASDIPPPPPPPLPILRGSGSGGGRGEENALLPLMQPPPPMYHQNLFIQEDEMASWLHHSYLQDYLLYSGVGSTPATHQQSSFSLAQPPSAPYILPPERPTGQILATGRAENFTNFSWLRGNIFTSGRVDEAGPWTIPVVQVDSSASTSSSATETCVVPATEGIESRVSPSFAVPGLDRKGKAVAINTAGTPSLGVCKAETEPPIQVQPAMETEIADDRKQKQREETIAQIQETKEAPGSTSRKRSRTAEMHNLAERRRREKINKNMKALQELIPHCSKSDKASVLEEAIQYVKSLEMHIQMMSTGHGMMAPTMYAGNMQPFMPHMAMGMNRPPPFIPFPGTPFPRPDHMAGLDPSYMGEDDIVELLWKSGQAVRSSLTQRANSDNPSPPPPVLRGSGSGSGGGSVEENALLPVPQPPPTCPMHHQNLFMQEDEMASWLHHPLRQDYIGSELLYSGAASTPATQPQSCLSLAAPPSSPYGQSVAGRREENFMDFWRLRENILTGGRVEAGPVVIESTQMGSSTFPATESYLTPATHDNESQATFFGGVSRTFAVPSRGPKDKAVAIETVCEIAGTSSSGVETEPVQLQPATETEIADDRKGKEREETHKTEEARGSTSRKRSRTAEMHNLAEKTRREKINDKIKTLQELIPHCSKSSRASMLEDVIKHVQSLHMQLQMMSGMMPQMYAVNMQQFMPHMAMGMMDMNRPPPFIPFPGTPFPRQAQMAGMSPSSLAPHYPFPNIQPTDPSRVHLPSLQPGSNPVSNQPQFPAYLNPYSQFVGLHQSQQPPPPLQSQTTSQPSFGQASSRKEPEDQDNQPTG